MGQYNKAILTAAGENLIARALAGEIQLNITKAKTSNYIYPAGTDFQSLTDLQGIKQTVSDPATAVYNDTMIQTRILFSNEAIESTYYIHNIGLYAVDGTQEVLFCIVTAETPDEMPQYNGVASTSYIYNIQNVVQDAAELNIAVNPSGTATIQDVLERVDATGGDISETVIETLETVEDKYPLPTAGESVKRFFGKVLTFLRNIRPLTSDIMLYVSANTGSDIIGNGTQASPFMTIQHAINTIPKDLNGHTAVINITAGVYNDDIIFAGFGSTGVIKIILTGDVVVSTVTVLGCTVIITSDTGVRTISTNSMLISDLANLHSWATVMWNLLGFRTTGSEGSFSMCIARGSTSYVSGSMTLSGNTGTGISVLACSAAFFGTLSGTGFTYGVRIENLSKFNCIVNNLSATTRVFHAGGGMEIQPNGTQISGIISSGLSCTWGTIYGGYIRHGNMNGVAMVTVQVQIAPSHTLTAGTDYLMPGFPTNAYTSVCVTVSPQRLASNCYISTSGTLSFAPMQDLQIGDSIALNCTYITNS